MVPPAPIRAIGRAVVEELENETFIGSRQDILERARVEAAETQTAHQLLPPIRIDAVGENRNRDGLGRSAGAGRAGEQAPQFVEGRRGGEIHLANQYPVGLVAGLANLDHLAFQLGRCDRFGSLHEQVADDGRVGPESARQPRVAVRGFEIAHRLAGEQKILEHAFFHQRQRLRRDAVHVHRVVPEQRMAAPLGLGWIVNNIHPLGQNARAETPFELARWRPRRGGPAPSPDGASRARFLPMTCAKIWAAASRSNRTGPL